MQPVTRQVRKLLLVCCITSCTLLYIYMLHSGVPGVVTPARSHWEALTGLQQIIVSLLVINRQAEPMQGNAAVIEWSP
jgi:hypothetical protein